jgi:hypothetical protein
MRLILLSGSQRFAAILKGKAIRSIASNTKPFANITKNILFSI